MGYTVMGNKVKGCRFMDIQLWVIKLWECTIYISDCKHHGFCNMDLVPSHLSLFHHNHWTRNFRFDRVSGFRRYSEL